MPTRMRSVEDDSWPGSGRERSLRIPEFRKLSPLAALKVQPTVAEFRRELVRELKESDDLDRARASRDGVADDPGVLARLAEGADDAIGGVGCDGGEERTGGLRIVEEIALPRLDRARKSDERLEVRRVAT